MALHVLMYHEILPRAAWPATGAGPVRTAQGNPEVLPQALYLEEESFVDQMDFLLREGFIIVSPEAVAQSYGSGTPLPDRSVLVTFDDLWKGGMTVAHRVLRERGLRALAFLVSGWIFDQPQVPVPGSPVCLSWPEVDELLDVFALANHSDRLHVRGPAGPALLSVDDQEFGADLARCERRTTLKGVFAYPYGVPGPQTAEQLRREGYTLAFTTVPGANLPGTDPLRLRRSLVPWGTGLDAFAKILDS